MTDPTINRQDGTFDANEMRPVEFEAIEVLSEAPESLGQQAWRRFRRHRLAMIGIMVLVLEFLAFFLLPFVLPDYDAINVLERSQGVSLRHPFGTDDLGRDLFARGMRGGQYSLRIAIITGLIGTSVGTFIGAISGYFSGVVDAISSFVINVLLTVPLLLILIIFGREFGARPNTVALLIASLAWMRAARLVRAQVIQLKEREFVQAARAAGASSSRIIVRHLVPNLVGTLLVEITLLAGTAIILESTLSFLGLGVQPPDTTLGTLINEAKGSLDTRPSRLLIPGGIVTLMILSFNFIGDGLRDAIDPKSEDR